MPFTAEQFFHVFEQYNLAVFPMQIVLVLLALIAATAAVKTKSFPGEIISLSLAFFWLWTGLVYHVIFFAQINSAAPVFGSMFLLQGLLFIREGIQTKRLSFKFRPDFYGILGTIFIVYALVIYPAIGFALGRIYPSSPTFGAPCPVVIFTFGLFMWTDKKLPWHLLIIPVLWAFIATTAALSFGVKEDFGLLIAGTIGTAFIIRRDFMPEKEILL